MKALLFLALFSMTAVSFGDENVTGGPDTDQSVTDQQRSITNPFDVTQYGMSARCQVFIKPDGSFGPWGQSLSNAIDKDHKKCFYGMMDYSSVCPSFKSFSKQEKKQFVVFMFAALANAEHVGQGEEGCNDWVHDANGKEVNRQPAKQDPLTGGMLYLEETARVRQMRPKACRSKTANPLDMDFQMQCGSAMFADLTCGHHQGLAGAGRYFGTVRNGDFQKLVSMYPHCAKK